MNAKRVLGWGMLLVVACCLIAGCGGDPGNAVPATQAEIDNDPALKEPGV